MIDLNAVALGAALVAGLARGFSGFGAALIFVPIASAALGPKLAVPLLLITDGVMTLPMIPGAVRRCNWSDVLAMAAGALLGIPLGTWILTHGDPLAIRWSISALIGVLLLVLISGWRYRSRPHISLTSAVGLVAGVLSGAAQVGGPPVVVYWLGGAIPPVIVRANIVAYFAISTAITTVTYLSTGLLKAEVLRLALLAAPLYGLGVWTGTRLFGIANEVTFRRVCYGLIALAAVGSVPALDRLWR